MLLFPKSPRNKGTGLESANHMSLCFLLGHFGKFMMYKAPSYTLVEPRASPSLCHIELIWDTGSPGRKPEISYWLGFLFQVIKISVGFYYSELFSSRTQGTSAMMLTIASLAYSSIIALTSYRTHAFLNRCITDG